MQVLLDKQLDGLRGEPLYFSSKEKGLPPKPVSNCQYLWIEAVIVLDLMIISG